MAIIAPCTYTDGKLSTLPLIPKIDATQRLDQRRNNVWPSFTIGYTHIHRITSYGTGQEDAEAKMALRKRSFFRKMRQVEGFKTIKEKNTGGVIPINRSYAAIFEVIYAIEDTGTRTQARNAHSPYPEFQLDAMKSQVSPETLATVTIRTH